MTTQIATRAYALYEQQGRQDGQSVQNWDKAEQEIKEDQSKVEPEAEAKAKRESEAKVEPKPEAKAEPKPEDKVKSPSDLTPQLVKRVHQLYEDLGRQEVRAVEELEKADRDNQTDEKKADAKPENNTIPEKGGKS